MRKFDYTVNEKGCHICTSHVPNKDGHIEVEWGGRRTLLHRWVYEMEYGPIPEGMVIRHKCDNPACMNIKHLELGTHLDNVKDRVTRGRSAAGIKNGRAKLTEADVKAIRADTTSTVSSLARLYGVDRRAIRDVKSFNTWRGVG